MKVGTVVYFAGLKDAPAGFDLEAGLAEKGLLPDTTEITGAGPQEPGPQFAELLLRRRGAHKVEYAKAFLDPETGLKVTRAGI